MAKRDPVERILTDPHPDLVAEGRCGRWHRDGPRTRAGGRTRRQEALALYRERAKGRSAAEREAIATELRGEYAEARCNLRVPEAGRACKQRHGGKSPSGPDAGGFEHGGSMKLRRFSAEESELYHRALRDPMRFAYDPQLAVLSVLLDDAMARRASGATLETLRQAKQSMDSFWAAGRRSDEPGMARHATRVGELLTQALDERRNNTDARNECLALLKEMRSTMSAEHTRRHRESVLLSIDEIRAQDARLVELMWETMDEAIRGADDGVVDLVKDLDGLWKLIENGSSKSARVKAFKRLRSSLGARHSGKELVTRAFVSLAERVDAEAKRWAKETGLVN